MYIEWKEIARDSPALNSVSEPKVHQLLAWKTWAAKMMAFTECLPEKREKKRKECWEERKFIKLKTCTINLPLQDGVCLCLSACACSVLLLFLVSFSLVCRTMLFLLAAAAVAVVLSLLKLLPLPTQHNRVPLCWNSPFLVSQAGQRDSLYRTSRFRRRRRKGSKDHQNGLRV